MRHGLIPGVMHRIEGGHRFGWHMRLRGKDGQLMDIIRNPAGSAARTVEPSARLEGGLVRKVATRPYMIRQYAQYLAREAGADGSTGARSFVRSRVRLNGRQSQVMIVPEVDLARATMRDMAHNHGLIQLAKPLPEDRPGRRRRRPCRGTRTGRTRSRRGRFIRWAVRCPPWPTR
ncbi:MAG: hypothetical protein ACPGPE_03995 [Planctomycetota bacterium]